MVVITPIPMSFYTCDKYTKCTLGNRNRALWFLSVQDMNLGYRLGNPEPGALGSVQSVLKPKAI